MFRTADAVLKALCNLRMLRETYPQKSRAKVVCSQKPVGVRVVAKFNLTTAVLALKIRKCLEP